MLRMFTIIALFAFAANAQAAVITNGSFENGNFVPNADDTMSLPVGATDIASWTVTVDSIAWIGPGNPFGLTASDGDYFLDLTDYAKSGNGGVQQSVATTIGASYLLSFDLASSTVYNSVPAQLTVSAAGFSQNYEADDPDGWTTFTLAFTATSATTLVNLNGIGTGGNYIGLDNVSIIETTGASVPEPTTMLLWGAGGLALLWNRRRRAK